MSDFIKHWRDILPKYAHPQLDHGPAKNRRELIARGFMLGGGMVFAPNMFTMAAGKLYGAELKDCSGAASASYLPTLSVHFQGGSLFAGHFIPGAKGGQGDTLSLAALGTIGLSAVPTLDMSIGIPMDAGSSLLAGIKSVVPAAVQANMNGLLIPNVSRDDNAANDFGNITHYLLSSGKGVPKEVAKIVGNGNGADGGRYTVSPEALTTATPVRIQSAADAGSLVNQGRLGELLGDNANIEKFMKMLHSSSSEQLKNLADLTEQQKLLVECGYLKAGENLTKFTPDALSPLNDPAVTGITYTANNTFAAADTRDDERADTIFKLAIDGYATHGVLQIGGCDNHGSSAAQQADKDYNSGRLIGRAFAQAAAKNLPLVMVLCSDGAKGARNGTPDANARDYIRTNSDNGARGSVVVLMYDPKGRPEILDGDGTVGFAHQVGAFQKDGGAVDTTVGSLSNSVDNACKFVVNQINVLQGKPEMFDVGVPARVKPIF